MNYKEIKKLFKTTFINNWNKKKDFEQDLQMKW
jgi:hypothetical protein